MRYSFTGPSELSAPEIAHAATVVMNLVPPALVTTGAASGWDMAAAFAALRAWPRANHQVICPGARYDRAGVAALTEAAASLGLEGERFTVVYLPPELTAATSYRRRNELLVAAGDVLIAAVRSGQFYRSGEWMTVNIAKRAGVPVEFVDLRTAVR